MFLVLQKLFDDSGRYRFTITSDFRTKEDSEQLGKCHQSPTWRTRRRYPLNMRVSLFQLRFDHTRNENVTQPWRLLDGGMFGLEGRNSDLALGKNRAPTILVILRTWSEAGQPQDLYALHYARLRVRTDKKLAVPNFLAHSRTCLQ